MTITCDEIINCAGLESLTIANSFSGLEQQFIPKKPSLYSKGNYFSLNKKSPFKHLIYPVPIAGGLGTHSTLDLNGQTKFGPDVEWTKNLDYNVDPTRATLFYSAIRQYWPELPDGSLLPSYSGIRPKLRGSDLTKNYQDFVIQGPKIHKKKGLVNLFGIESPGLTSSLSIAEHVFQILED